MTEPASHSGSAEPSDHDLLVAVGATQGATNLNSRSRTGGVARGCGRFSSTLLRSVMP
jgi:hypothetical protein